MDKLRTVGEAARKIGRTTQRIYQLIGDGRLKAERLGEDGSVVRIRESEINRYIESTKIPDALPPIEEVAAA